MLVEVTNSKIPWTAPQDFDVTSPTPLTLSSPQAPDSNFFLSGPRNGTYVATADGAIHFLPAELLDRNKYPDLFKIGGFKPEYLNQVHSKARQINWPNCLALSVWLLSIAILFLRASQAKTLRLAETRAGEGVTDEHDSGHLPKEE